MLAHRFDGEFSDGVSLSVHVQAILNSADRNDRYPFQVRRHRWLSVDVHLDDKATRIAGGDGTCGIDPALFTIEWTDPPTGQLVALLDLVLEMFRPDHGTFEHTLHGALIHQRLADRGRPLPGSWQNHHQVRALG